VIAVALLVGGCGTPPWQQAASPAPATSGSDAATASPSATPAPSSTAPSSTAPSSTPPTAAPEVENDLSKGSLKRTLTAGAAELKVTYWSTLDLGDWVPQVPKPVNVVASARLDGGAKGQNVYLSAVRAASTAVAADGSPTVLDPVQDKAQVKPGYLVSAPSSYQQVFSIPPAPTGCTAVQLTITYELLIQAAPDSTTYLRQATSDTIQVPLVS
jgi:hypothetical protein